MATSPSFNWPEPDNTDLVKNGALAIRTAVDAIDTSMTDLLGGTTGQVLAKASNTDMDFSWVAQDDSNAIQNTQLTAKGALISAFSAGTPATLTVGTNGQTLVADSTAATGLKWAASPNFVGCALWKSANQSIATTTSTIITFDNEFFDTNGFHDNATNPSRITIPAGLGGKYQINCAISFDLGTGTGIRAMTIWKNGGVYLYANMTNANAVYGQNITSSVVLDLAAGDYVEMGGFQTTGVALNVIGSGLASLSQLSATFLGA
jgi:hypothetical protein